MSASSNEVVLQDIAKSFGGVVANAGIDARFRRGEIHAVLGENGAGKTTLMNILSGLYRPDRGVMTLWGERATFHSPSDAVLRGVGMVHQHFQLVEVFSVLDNVLLGKASNRLLLDRRRAAGKLCELGRRHGLDVDPDAYVWQLSVGQKQKLEILKLLYHGAELLLLDEPTSVLTPQEAAELYRSLRVLADSGKAIVFITHKLHEVVQAADRITVLRRGQVIGSFPKGRASVQELGALMVGVQIDAPRRPAIRQASEAVLTVSGLHAQGNRGTPALAGVDLTLHRGEILALAGVAGNGQPELAEVLSGLRRPTLGRILIAGRDMTSASVLDRMRAGLRYVPEDRNGTGLVTSLDIADNVMLRDFRDRPLSRGPWLNRTVSRLRARKLVEEYDIRTDSIDRMVGTLSGGNQQKLLLGREMLANPIALLVAQPTRGLDIAATASVHERLLQMRDAGVAVMLISEDLDEVLQIGDRIAVMYQGRVTYLCLREEARRDQIGAAMGGSAFGAAA